MKKRLREGAKLIVVVNPLVPYVNDFTKEIPTLFGTRTRRVSDMGFPKIGYQTFKLLAYQRLHEDTDGAITDSELMGVYEKFSNIADATSAGRAAPTRFTPNSHSPSRTCSRWQMQDLAPTVHSSSSPLHQPHG